MVRNRITSYEVDNATSRMIGNARFGMDEHGKWKFKCASMEIFIRGSCKATFGGMICDHGVVDKGCYGMLICKGNMANFGKELIGF